MSEKCAVDPTCEMPGEAKKMRLALEQHTKKWDEHEKEAKASRAHYRDKLDIIKTCVEKTDRTLHGEEGTGHVGMMARVKYLEDTSGVSQFLNYVWKIVKKPVVIAIVMFWMSALSYVAYLYFKAKGL
ncbi:MAG TPA: hypothetical protein ENG93_02535 [Nitrospirae bacterium]|nr:hypothetical protein [Nitrospirota bacterium]